MKYVAEAAASLAPLAWSISFWYPSESYFIQFDEPFATNLGTSMFSMVG